MNVRPPGVLGLPGLVAVGTSVFPLACFLVLSFNVNVAPHLYWYDQQRIGQVAALSLMALTCVACLVVPACSMRFVMPSPWVRCALAVFFAMGAVSAARAASVPDALLEWSRFVLLVFLAWVVSTGTRAYPRAACLMLMASIAVAVAWFLGARLGPYVAIVTLSLPLSHTAFLDGFDNPRFFGQLQTMTLPLLMLPLILPGISGRMRLCACVLLAAWWTLAWLSGSRGTLYALLATGAASAILFGAWGRRYALLSLCLALAGGLSYWLLFFVVPHWLGSTIDGTSFERGAFTLSSREALWTLSIQRLAEHPLLGIGPMHFAREANPVGAHPHSIPLQIAAEWGAPAAFVAMVGIALAVAGRTVELRRLLRESRTGSEVQMDAILLIAIAAALTQGLVDGVFVVPYTETLLATLIGFAWGRAGLEHAGRPIPYGGRLILGLGLSCVAIMLAVITWTQAVHLDERILEQESRAAVLLPRFWSAGWIDSAPE